jgi:hypothetical protein
MTNYNETTRHDEHDTAVDADLDHVGRMMLELLRASDPDAKLSNEELLKGIAAGLTEPKRQAEGYSEGSPNQQTLA